MIGAASTLAGWLTATGWLSADGAAAGCSVAELAGFSWAAAESENDKVRHARAQKYLRRFINFLSFRAI
jgi:hypothetical protein